MSNVYNHRIKQNLKAGFALWEKYSFGFSRMADGFHGLVEQLFAAARGNDLGKLQKLCTSSPKSQSLLLKQRDANGSSALLIAAGQGHWEVTRFLLELGSDINQNNTYGWSALLLCIYYGEIEYFRRIISQPGIDLNAHNVFGHTALTVAVDRNQFEMLKDLLSSGAYVNYRASHCSDGLTPLMLACFKGSRQMVATLLDHGAEVNAQNKLNMWTPLMYAATKYLPSVTESIVRILLEYGADAKVRNRIGMTCIDIANECGNEDFLTMLQIESDSSSWTSSGQSESKKKIKRAPIFDAIENKNRPLILSLLHGERECINEIDKATGVSPLIFAILENDITSVKVLLDFGADVEVKHSKTGLTPLMYAVLCRNVDIVKLLLSRGADQSASGNIFGAEEDCPTDIIFTVREVAAMNNYPEITHLFDMHATPTERHGIRREDLVKMPQYLVKKIRDLIHFSNFPIGHVLTRANDSMSSFETNKENSTMSPIRRFFSFKKRRKSLSNSQASYGKLDRASIFFNPRFDTDSNRAVSSTSTIRSRKSVASPPSIPYFSGQKQSSSAQLLFESNRIDTAIYERYRDILDSVDKQKLLEIRSDDALRDMGITGENDRQIIFLGIMKARQKIAIAEVDKIRKRV